MKKKLNYAWIALMMFTTLLFPSGTSTASNSVAESQQLSGTGITIQSTMYLKSWSSTISQNSAYSIQATGYTESYSAVDTIQVSLYLQYWNGISWENSTFLNTYSNQNSKYVYGSKNVIVQSGYSYRTKSIHYVYEGGSLEQVTSYSNILFVP